MPLTVAVVYPSNSPRQSTGAANRDSPPWRIGSINYEWSFIGIWYNEADIDIKDEKKSEIDINYLVINYIDAVLDKIYPSIDIFYPKRTK
jgi:hypothetical protein